MGEAEEFLAALAFEGAGEESKAETCAEVFGVEKGGGKINESGSVLARGDEQSFFEGKEAERKQVGEGEGRDASEQGKEGILFQG